MKRTGGGKRRRARCWKEAIKDLKMEEDERRRKKVRETIEGGGGDLRRNS